MNGRLISIIIPTFNNGHFFHRLITSLQSQKYINWEAIVVDNNSIDNTLNIISEYNDPRIRVYSINNGGVIAKSRNLGIIFAKGEWIAFLDSDDWWDSDKLKICSKYFNLDYDLIYHKLEIITSKLVGKKKYLYSRRPSKNFHKDLIINGNFIPNSSVLIKKKLLVEVGLINEDINLIGSEDFNLWLRVSKYTNKVKYLPIKLGYYYHNESGVSRKNMKISYLEAIKPFLSKCTINENKYIIAHINYIDATFYMRQLKYNESKKVLINSLQHGTFRIKLKSIFNLLKLFLIKLK